MCNVLRFIFLLLQLFPAVLSGHPGWFASVRGGQLSPHPSSVYPRALSNIAYAYGHIEDTDDDDEVVNVKSTAAAKKWSDEDYEEEDHFFHSLYHNNDERVVTNVSVKNEDNTEDVELEDVIMFKRLNDKIFHRRRNGDEKKEGGGDEREVVNVRYGLDEVFEDVSFFE
mmetsp:Transcript_26674/g.38133  ORF Transcript_26674/g.38133 Transcript_26674/m.38133 type:complete len:169 (+) Transcript_26674:88-594(+)|eukprot:CAMPEP_0201688008 /NCGR_PEP_ID=MMETSP0578-20130828/1800_1 /ASSEMBLY_ACC=CAM_ASM_000663 /TAXON_ID=267565 /ORGANISM="Skeletonema grethea, Strain CCMP 1804" /LENGTH=168 /DNA_ID=CAMNT_0048172197 /DNA_START=73 /DNA_END=579 /DNA_ORIENTATION=-